MPARHDGKGFPHAQRKECFLFDNYLFWTINIQLKKFFCNTDQSQLINPTLIRVYPRKPGWPDLPQSNSNLTQFTVSSFSKPTLLLSFSTCVFHVFFGCPYFLLPFTSNSTAFLKTCPSSLLNTCPYHLIPFAFAIVHCFLQSQVTLG